MHSLVGFKQHYGPWALVCGASEGLGAAWADALAARGLNLVAVARRESALHELAVRLRGTHGVEVRTLAADLAAPDACDRIERFCDGLEIGALVYNAAASPIGPFLEQDTKNLDAVTAVNCATLLRLVRTFGGRMKQRGRGGVVLMASLAGLRGSSMIAAYAASKAFTVTLARGLWREWRGSGVHVLACVAGATRTPGYLSSKGSDQWRVPGEMDPSEVVAEAIRALGRKDVVIPGRMNRFAAFLLTRVLPGQASVALVSGRSEKLRNRQL